MKMLALFVTIIFISSDISVFGQVLQCGFNFNGNTYTSRVFTEPDQVISLVNTASDCQLRALVIGGGGWNVAGGISTGGGGSGYLQYHTEDISANTEISDIQVSVGADRQASSISINGVLIESAAGANGGGIGGEAGDGYSGGGYGGKYNGGSDGGNGEGGSGDMMGEGTGLM